MDKLMMVEQELKASLKKDYPQFSHGDIIKVYYKIREKEKEGVLRLVTGEFSGQQPDNGLQPAVSAVLNGGAK
ncbi:MAG: 50S ribosomal protein L19 [Oligoflexales bacterium]|nr:50S ribosomal protein L19 [Oligoflexales bacterium]